MLRIARLASAAALCAVPQAPSGPESRETGERVRLFRLMREDLDYESGKGVASEGLDRISARLEAEIDGAVEDLGVDCFWVGNATSFRRSRVVGIAFREGGAQDGVERRLKSIGFRVDRVVLTGIKMAPYEGRLEREVDFLHMGGVADVARVVPSPDGRTALVLHLPECKAERLLALSKHLGGEIAWEPIRLEVVSGDPGIGGMKLQQALRAFPGIRLVPPGANADSFTVEVEMRELSELQRRGSPFGASPAPIVDRLRKAGIEVREAR